MFGSIYSYIKEFIYELKHPSADVICEAVQEQKELCEKIESLHWEIISGSVEMQALCAALQSFGVDATMEKVAELKTAELFELCKYEEISLTLLAYKMDNYVKEQT